MPKEVVVDQKAVLRELEGLVPELLVHEVSDESIELDPALVVAGAANRPDQWKYEDRLKDLIQELELIHWDLLDLGFPVPLEVAVHDVHLRLDEVMVARLDDLFDVSP